MRNNLQSREWTEQDGNCRQHSSTNNKQREQSELLAGDVCCCQRRYSCLSWSSSSSVSHSQKAYLIVPSMAIKTTES